MIFGVRVVDLCRKNRSFDAVPKPIFRAPGSAIAGASAAIIVVLVGLIG